MNLLSLLEQFPNNEACRQHLIRVRWPEGVKCPRCNHGFVSELKSRKQWTCLRRDCRYRFSATAGTIFHQSHIGLRKWFIAVFVVLNAKKSLSSLQLKRELGISQECCWHMFHRIREAMREDHSDLFTGIVQADEYYHGGKPRGAAQKKDRYDRTTDGRKTAKSIGRGTNKQAVLGAIEVSTGRIRTRILPDIKGKTLAKILGKWIDEPETHLHTDELRSYNRFGRVCAAHRVVNHAREYVTKEGVHTNNVESAWSLLDRAIIGSFHKISRKHLHRYLAEFDSRFNSRSDDAEEFFNRILTQADGRRLKHQDLVESSS